jgi:hypothetical protein
MLAGSGAGSIRRARYERPERRSPPGADAILYETFDFGDGPKAANGVQNAFHSSSMCRAASSRYPCRLKVPLVKELKHRVRATGFCKASNSTLNLREVTMPNAFRSRYRRNFSEIHDLENTGFDLTPHRWPTGASQATPFADPPAQAIIQL